MSSNALDQLRAEHRYMSKLLEFLEHQVELVAYDRQPDGELLLEICEYFACIPDLVHHPKEDVLLRQIVARNAVAAHPLLGLESEHEEGGRELKRLLRAAVRLLLGAEDAADRFLSAALAFIRIERTHMAWEQRNLFEIAERVLLPEDWAEIDGRLRCFTRTKREREEPSRFHRLDRRLAPWRSSELALSEPEPLSPKLKEACRS